jgi:hypothetical protein
MRRRAKFLSASLTGGAWPTAALLIALLIWRPGWFLALGLGLAAIAATILLLALAVYAFAMLAPERAKKAGIRLSEVSFLGKEHAGSRLCVIEGLNETSRVEQSPGYYAVVFLALAAGGPGLLAMFIVKMPISDIYNPMIIFAVIFSIALCILLAYQIFIYVFQRPSVKMEPGAVVLCSGRREVKRFCRTDIAGLRIETRLYYDEDGSEARYNVLVARLSDGSEKRLLASGPRKEIEQIVARMRFLLDLG